MKKKVWYEDENHGYTPLCGNEFCEDFGKIINDENCLEENDMEKSTVNQDNIYRVEEELDYAICECYDAPIYIIAKIVFGILDTAEKEKRLNAKERKIACDYISKCYGYNF